MAEEGIKKAAVSDRIARVNRKRQMTPEDGLFVVAAQAGLKLNRYGLNAEELARVADHLTALEGSVTRKKASPSATAPVAALPTETPSSRFSARNFHEIVVRRSRKAFTTRQYHDAVLRAFKSVNNRVKKLTGSSKDGQDLMAHAFRDSNPLLTLSSRGSESEKNEHEGTRFMMMGAVRAMRNPRAHEDDWPRDADEAYVLDALAYASLLHRLLDIAEDRLP